MSTICIAAAAALALFALAVLWAACVVAGRADDAAERMARRYRGQHG